MPTATQLLFYALPPVLGALIGYGTNDLAIRMLFRPYRAYHLGTWRVPFTPGMIPKEQGRIAEKVATTVTTHLLTPDEIRKLSRRLVSEENINAMVDRLLDRVNTELADPDRRAALAEVVGGLAAGVVHERLPQILDQVLESDELDRLSLFVSDRVIERLQAFRFSPEMAGFLAQKSLQVAFTPENLRKALIWALTRENSEALANRLKERAGPFGWLVDIIEPVALLQRFRETLESDPEKAEQMLASLLVNLEVEGRIARWLENLKLEDLPPETVEAIRTRGVEAVKEGLRANDRQIVTLALEHLDVQRVFTQLMLSLGADLLPDHRREAIRAPLARMLHQYLDTEIEMLAGRALEAIDLRSIIVKNVNAFSPERVERIIYEISRKELKGIIYLGGALGFMVGCVQVALGVVLR